MIKFFRALRNLSFSIDGQCPATQRGRPVGVDEGGAANSEKSLCEKTTKKGRKIYYKTKRQKEIDQKTKDIKKDERAKTGKKKGRFSNSSKEKISEAIKQLATMKEIFKNPEVQKIAKKEKPAGKQTDEQRIHERLKAVGYPFDLPKITSKNKKEWEDKLAGYENKGKTSETKQKPTEQKNIEEKKPEGKVYNSKITPTSPIKKDSEYIENEVMKKLEGPIFDAINEGDRQKYEQNTDIFDIAKRIEKKTGVRVGGGLLLKALKRMEKNGEIVLGKAESDFLEMKNSEFISPNFGPAFWLNARIIKGRKKQSNDNPSEDLKAIQDNYYKKAENLISQSFKGKKVRATEIERVLGSGAMAQDVIRNLIEKKYAKIKSSPYNNEQINDIPLNEFPSLGIIETPQGNVLAREIEIL